jgi:hypothetical protein
MLRLDLAGQEFLKAERNRALQERLNGRNGISIEFKRENISAVPLDLELPNLDGYALVFRTVAFGRDSRVGRIDEWHQLKCNVLLRNRLCSRGRVFRGEYPNMNI